MKYVLFKEVCITPELSPWDMFYRSIPGDEWKYVDDKGKPQTKKINFVGIVDTPAALLALIQEAPGERYLLFRGEVDKISIANSVFVDGKNVATLDSEWGEETTEGE